MGKRKPQPSPKTLEEAALDQAPASPLQAAPEPPSAEELAELGVTVEEDGLCPVKMLVGASGEGFALQADDFHRCDPITAASWVRRHIARPKHRKA